MLIPVSLLPNTVRRTVNNECDETKQIDLCWSNGCNEEGEDYFEIYIEHPLTSKKLLIKSGWGEVSTVWGALEELYD